MLIFLAIVMGPGLGFMLFALRQFWLEARRFRYADPRRLRVTVVTATDAWNERAARAPQQTHEGEKHAGEKVTTTYLKNCFAAIPSGTGCEAMEHVAKGSS
jgi:hypothetical protein